MTQRGHGGSSTAASYRTRDFAADAAALVATLGLPPVLVVGHSMGAVNALRLAIDHPDAVRGVVAAAGFASFSDKPELVDFIQQPDADAGRAGAARTGRSLPARHRGRPAGPGAAADDGRRMPAHTGGHLARRLRRAAGRRLQHRAAQDRGARAAALGRRRCLLARVGSAAAAAPTAAGHTGGLRRRRPCAALGAAAPLRRRPDRVRADAEVPC